ncbi:hypothetical protein DL189_18485 [Enterobacter hormaechei]|uniref:Uncharacterized protein n=1 Tax=Enterobacter hormaechei TaxID=158836 RepID=A0A9X7KZK3_9ENTR|nr:hypothetical protein DL189_18485 [Enterobacter hormaechei]
MMSLWDALRMNMMISYQELVRTFPSSNVRSWHKADSDHRSYDYFLTSFVTCPKHVVVRYS